MDNIIEHWRDVKNSEKYEVSNLGNVRNKKTNKILTPQSNRKYGYMRVRTDAGRQFVHRMVYEAFHGTDITGYDINHIDGNKMNNSIANLEACTRRENLQHASRNNLYHVSVIPVVRCKNCSRRYQYDVCQDKDEDFYCGYGEL